MKLIAEALEWKFGPVADTVDGKISEWRTKDVPQPTEEELAQVLSDYQAHLEKMKDSDPLAATIAKTFDEAFTQDDLAKASKELEAILGQTAPTVLAIIKYFATKIQEKKG